MGKPATPPSAARRRVGGLFLKNPPPLREMILRRFGWWNLWLLAGPVAVAISRGLDSIANAKGIQGAAIFFLGGRGGGGAAPFSSAGGGGLPRGKRGGSRPRAHPQC